MCDVDSYEGWGEGERWPAALSANPKRERRRERGRAERVSDKENSVCV